MLALLAIVGISGVVVGLGVAYPVSKINVSAENVVALDQVDLAGSFDPQLALVTGDDLPDNWTDGDPAFAKFSMIGSPICGQTPEIADQLGDKLVRVFTDDRNKAYVISEAIRVRQPRSANQFITEMSKDFEGCKVFFRTGGDSPTKVQVRAGQPDQPVSDYVSRDLIPTDKGVMQRVVFFYAGDVIVSLQYIGPTTPQRSLLSNAQKQILARVAPKQFGHVRKIAGAQPVPEEPTTTTTSSTTTTLPPTTLVPPTTTTKRRTPTTLKKTPTTAAAPPAAPTTAKTTG